MQSTAQCFKSAKKKVTKWESYFQVYDQWLHKYVGKPISFLEIGVCDGGSLEMWKDYFGNKSKVIGIDIDPSAQNLFTNNERDITVEIGDQSDLVFLSYLIHKYGVPDVVIDDESHRRRDIWSSATFFLPRMRPGSLYIVEDLHGTFWDPSEAPATGDNTFTDFLQLVNSINSPGSRGALKHVDEWGCVYSISFYWSMVIIQIESRTKQYSCICNDGAGNLSLVTAIPS